MKAAELASRFRVFIFVSLYLIGFLAPWELRSGHPGTLWLAASTLLARSGWISLADATVAVTLVSLACLVIGTILRVWGTAYLGSGVMRGAEMQGQEFVAAGPYRYVRNPLYLGSWLLALGVCVLMPPSGAGFFLIAFSVFVLLLIGAEERFLSAKQGDVYRQYRQNVPRLWPRLISRNAATSAVHPHWAQAFLAETYAVAITLCFGVLAWRYNARILVQCVLVCYGVSLVVRALTGKGVEAKV
jgi:protein-S-isoprenylcysteine O-methyltransferase Ste14